jgi:hypothetical protein
MTAAEVYERGADQPSPAGMVQSEDDRHRHGRGNDTGPDRGAEGVEHGIGSGARLPRTSPGSIDRGKGTAAMRSAASQRGGC